MRELQIPKTFLTDHLERDLPAPPVLRYTKAYAVIDGDHPAVADLREDAAFYAGNDSTDAPASLKRAARALLLALGN